ncbi:alpha-mannosidase [Paenibacillus sp. YN15]|uniref:alpha-mannosidase n=1 Tax=Paenibacillus sp. YN15 TaxID=1742774 RepID=UPI000DCCA832|nr:alpha-mannosidase [Paenibacillus sp. YN15]RAV04753.1 alpha-mannosidase [Paenibacillus sp. YN15]
MAFAKRTERFLRSLDSHKWLDQVELAEWSCRRAIYLEEGSYEYMEGVETVSPGQLVSKPGETLFLEKTAAVPASWRGGKIGLVFKAGGEGLLSLGGVPYHGLDGNRSFIPLPAELASGEELSLHIELYNVPPHPEDPLNGQLDKITRAVAFQEARYVLVNTEAERLAGTVKVIWEAARRLPEKDLRRIELERALSGLMIRLEGAGLETVLRSGRTELADAEACLMEAVSAYAPAARSGVMHMVGQSHIDVAWLWPLKETVRKTSRTFSTVCALMDEYPDFQYSQSQPLLYAFVKKHYPELYAKIKERIAEGRWELVGGMWVEPDLNMPSGESLVRQLLYGRAFYEEEFGFAPRVEWLPDTFGYCASLPQLLKKAGVDYFMTSKMNWNDTNPFPYDLFYWKGIDGTPVLSFLNHGLNENTLPQDVAEHWDSFRQKKSHPEQMLLYGHGDGGGGVTREMIETVARSKRLPDLPSSQFSTALAFFQGVEEAFPALPQWTGDMYLELHRGTYTTHARNKRWNRKAEVLYREAEIWNALSAWTGAAQLHEAFQVQKEQLGDGWKLLLLNQFHDIIPGTSIHEVYPKSEEHYGKVFSIGEKALQTGLERLVGQIATDGGEGRPVVFFNSLPWERRDSAVLKGGPELKGIAVYDGEGGRLEADCVPGEDGGVELHIHGLAVPGLGYRTVWLREQSGSGEESCLPAIEQTGLAGGSWENSRYRIDFDADGFIAGWLDKRSGRELLHPGEKANHLQLFHDRPTVWDAWDVDPNFESQPAEAAVLLSSEVYFKGKGLDILRMKWQLSDSLVIQDMMLYEASSRVDFRTTVEWREAHKLLKVAFPVDILSTKAAYEIPFGSIERPTHTNTSWEQAQFEVCGHRWADLSEGGYGISLLNDCKYGYDIKGHVMRLSLLRSPRWPDREADVGVHAFTYSFYPHEGDWRTGNVVREGYQLNHPHQAVWGTGGSGTLPSHGGFIQVNSRHAVLDTLKITEDGQGLLLRLYESSGGRETVELSMQHGGENGFGHALAEADLNEKTAGRTLPLTEGKARFPIRPYEVATFRLNQAE